MRNNLSFNICLLWFMIIFVTAACRKVPAVLSNTSLSEKEFLNPPLDSRPGALWTWMNGYVKKDQITRELEEMKAKGMRGGIIWDMGSLSDPDKIIPTGPAFLGKESLESINHAIDEASRLGLELGIAASSSWNAGGSWIRPEDGSKALLWSEINVSGSRVFDDTLPLPLNTNKYYYDVAALAIPLTKDSVPADPDKIIDISKNLDKTGHLKWFVPEGEWQIMRFVCSNTGQLLECPSPNSNGLVIDHLSRTAVDHHLTYMLDRLGEGKKDLGSLKYFEFDSYEVAEGIDWTASFKEGFVNTYGYDPVDYLPALSGKIIGSKEKTERFRHDYFKNVSDFIIENHFRRATEVLNKRGVKLIAEAGHGGYARVDALKAMGAVDIPMGEFWNHARFWVEKEAASAAHIYGKKFAPSESLTGWQHWKDGPLGYKRLIDVAFCAGLNQITFHTFAHNPPEAGLPGFTYHAGEDFNVNTTWWNYSKPFMDYLSRCCYMLQQGKFVADVCLYYGDQAPDLVPSRRIDPSLKPDFDSTRCLHCGQLRPVQAGSLGLGYDYDYVNEEVILTRMQVRDGLIVLPDGMSYHVLVMPDKREISLEVLRKVGSFIKAGATVVGPKPLRSNSLKNYPGCDKEVQEIAGRIWGNCDGDKIRENRYGKGKVIWNIPLREVLSGLKISQDFIVENIPDKDQHIDYIHRKAGKDDYYFISNSAYKSEEVSCFFRVENDMIPMLWNPADGSVSKIFEFEREAGGIRILMNLAPVSSLFVVFREDEINAAPLKVKRILVRNEKTGEDSVIQKNIEILANENNMLTARLWLPGTYIVENSKGKKCIFTADSIPKPILINTPWKLSFPGGWGAPDSVIMDKLTSWTDWPESGVKYFSGTATYSNSFTLNGEILRKQNSFFIDLGNVKEVAEVFINGKSAGIIWKEPFLADITDYLKPGKNYLKITVTNLWNNRITGDNQPGNKIRYTHTNMKRGFSSKTPLIKSGLSGNVRILTVLKVNAEFK